MERTTTSGKYDTTHENREPATRSNAGVTAAEQVPANGLNRAISVEEGESVSEALDESKTSRKSLYDRICNLWLIRKIRKIIGLFKKLLTCSGKDVAPVSKNAGKLMNVRDCTALADRLLCKVRALVETIEKQDPPPDQWTETELKLEELSDELTQLERNISAFMSRESDYEEMAINYLATQKTEIEMHIDWVKFYLASNKKSNYCSLNIHYFTYKLDLIFVEAIKMQPHNNRETSGKILDSHFAAKQDIAKKAGKGQISAALAKVDEFKSTVCNIILDAADLSGRFGGPDKSVTTRG